MMPGGKMNGDPCDRKRGCDRPWGHNGECTTSEPDRLAEAVALLRECHSVMEDIAEIAADRMDVTDGPDGQPSPDAWMALYSSLTDNVVGGPLDHVRDFLAKEGK